MRRDNETTLGSQGGYSLVELIIAMMLSLIVLGSAVAVFTSALQARAYQAARTDALIAAQAALNIMSREIGNAGYGMVRVEYGSNGLVLNDCSSTRIHFRTNSNNANLLTVDSGEDVVYYYDTTSDSIVRYDQNSNQPPSGIINKVSRVEFTYHNYASNGSITQGNASDATARVTVKLSVLIAGASSAPTDKRNVTVESDIVLRNSPYSLGQY